MLQNSVRVADNIRRNSTRAQRRKAVAHLGLSPYQIYKFEVSDLSSSKIQQTCKAPLPFQMLFSSKKVNSGWGYSIGILVANVIFILCATAVFINIEGPAELSEKQEDWKTKVHLMKHVKNSVMPPVGFEIC